MTATDSPVTAARLEKWVAGGMFAVLALLGLYLHRDYGIAWDEPWLARYGSVLWAFIFEGDNALLMDRARYHGTIVPFVWTAMEKLGWFTDSQTLYFFRHLGNFSLYYFGVLGFYFLCRRGFGSWTWGLLGTVFLVLSPRIFGHAFFNPKDIPFMSFFIWSIYTGVQILERPSWKTALIHALSCVVLINFRLLGVLVPALTLAFLGARFLFLPATRSAWRRTLAVHVIFISTMCIGVVLLWPTLWDQPLTQFINAFNHLARFPWRGDLLYLGEYYQSDHLPWHYPLVWMAVTIPIVYLVLMPVGLLDLLRRVLEGRPRFADYWLDLMVLCWMVAPVAAVLILQSVLYDDWRHLYFIYPAMLWFALKGVVVIWTWVSRGPGLKFRSAFVALLAFALLANAATIAVYHPYQNVYFNRLAGSGDQIRNRFELDYWGVSYRDGLAYIAATDPRESITVLAANLPGEWNSMILPPADRKRIRYVYDASDADYFVTNYRWHREDYAFEPPVYSISAGGARIFGVYDFRPSRKDGG
jgi:hypothetical protein